MMVGGKAAAALALAMMTGCGGHAPRRAPGVGQPPGVGQGPAVGQGPSVGTPPGPTVPVAPVAAPTCAFWNGARGLEVRTNAGRGDFFREFRYDFGTARVEVHDSDPFATGPETKVPRVIQRSVMLSPADKARTEQALFSACPSEADTKRSCAPGGCLRLAVQGGGGPPSLDDCDPARRALEAFEPFFPELRKF